MIQLEGLTKRFSNGKGIFDIQFEVQAGKVFGFLGPNGAGKTTTIRHLMGFFHPTKGTAKIDGMDCWQDAARIQEKVGYLPGEIALMENMNGLDLIRLICDMRRLKDRKRRDELIERFQFDPDVPIRKMSKGMKQKVGIILAFMHNPEILILDEPTSGLDPLMQKTFVELLEEEKIQGKTILMSSHMFQEIDRTCDQVGLIKEGRMITVNDVAEVRKQQQKVFVVTFGSVQEVEKLKTADLLVRHQEGSRVEVVIRDDYPLFLKTLASLDVQNLDLHTQSLEELFMHYYEQEGRS
ncbi:ABC transporter ATP-binding protein [Shimazuella kribbensis]|uniref:ABC transporter ATP-binding protein n=1 Tax=Shimazuella kribbensis TaxID=139808 RepID=UPI00040DD866|nr:ABC transporter ATP-binding protein [Shimazuella kribbensis]